MKRSGFANKTRKPLARISTNPANKKLRALKRATVSIGDLDKKLWQLTRQLVFRAYGTDCYTCPAKNLTGRNLQAGHMPWPKSVLSKECSYNIRYIRPQCEDCNCNRNGKPQEARARMIAEGIDVDALDRRNHETQGGEYGRVWTTAKIAEYEARTLAATPC